MLIDDWAAPLDAVAAEAFGGSFLTRGVLLRTPGQHPVLFWCGRRKQATILSMLRVTFPNTGRDGATRPGDAELCVSLAYH